MGHPAETGKKLTKSKGKLSKLTTLPLEDDSPRERRNNKSERGRERKESVQDVSQRNTDWGMQRCW